MRSSEAQDPKVMVTVLLGRYGQITEIDEKPMHGLACRFITRSKNFYLESDQEDLEEFSKLKLEIKDIFLIRNNVAGFH